MRLKGDFIKLFITIVVENSFAENILKPLVFVNLDFWKMAWDYKIPASLQEIGTIN